MGLSHVQSSFSVHVGWAQSIFSLHTVLADSEHMDVLRRGTRSWNDWRSKNRPQGPISSDFVERRGAANGANLTGADLSGAVLTDARLDGANLTNAELSHALLTRMNFAGAKLVGTRLESTNLAFVRNLTQDQIIESLGYAFTLLRASPGA